MAVNTSRSMNAELEAGRCDGMLNKVAPNRGGRVDAGTRNVRENLHADYGYGYISSDPTPMLHGDEAIPR